MMENDFKPAGYNSVSPYFIVEGAQKLVELLKELFDATELRRFDKPDGKIMHIELKIDDSVIMLADSTEQFAPNVNMLHVYVPDVNATFAKAISLGCVSQGEPKQAANDPDRRGTFQDFAGNSWSVGTQLPG